jgi:hypothetical protein
MIEGLTTQRRRTAAWVVCLVWLVGVEVLPNLHLVGHRADHSHDASGAMVAQENDHEHGHQHASAHHDEAPHDFDDVDPYTPGHAAAGIAHRAVALHQPAPSLLAPLPVELASWRIVHAPSVAVSTTQLARPTARGPPANA